MFYLYFIYYYKVCYNNIQQNYINFIIKFDQIIKFSHSFYADISWIQDDRDNKHSTYLNPYKFILFINLFSRKLESDFNLYLIFFDHADTTNTIRKNQIRILYKNLFEHLTHMLQKQ